MPSSLKNIQQQFSRAIYEKNDASPFDCISEQGISKAARLQIYRDNVLITLTHTLQNIYPSIVKLVGEKFFKYAANEYIKAHPSTSGNLDNYGQYFADFLSSSASVKDYPYLSDVARLELARHTAYMAADARPINIKSLTQIPSERHETLTFTLHPSAHLISSPHPIDLLWQLTQQPAPENETIDLKSRGADILVIRPEFKIEHHLLENGEYTFLKFLHNGSTLFQAYEATGVEDFDAGQAIQKFVLNNTLTDFAFAN